MQIRSTLSRKVFSVQTISERGIYKHIFSRQHQAAVKAVAWCPWQPSVLASGGGTADRCIRLWNCSNGSLLNTVDTKSQVCSLLWAPEYKELVSAHGYANNEVAIWKYPSMVSRKLGDIA